tara:strand:- start:52 stop:1038 length:987 start_codon:yes stop_codon:yes gene_type:complete
MAHEWASGLNVSRWAKQLAHEVGKEIYFSKFMGDSFNSMIVEKEMEEGKGADVTFGLVGLTGTAVTGDSSLEGNEDGLSSYAQTVTTSQRRFGVTNAGRFDDSKVLYGFRKEALAQLKRVYAEDVDSQIFSAMTASSGTFGNVLAVTSAASSYAATDQSGSLASAGQIQLEDISRLKRIAQLGGSATWKMSPIKVDGKDYYILLIHPEVAYDLFKLDDWTQAQREANVRGDENPIFKGSLGIYDGVVIHEHEGITTGTYNSQAGARNLFMGAGAACMGKIGGMSWVEKSFDYGNKLGVAAGKIYGVSRTAFNSKDYGCIQYISRRTDL